MIKPSPKQTFIGIWLHDKKLSNDVQNRMKLRLNGTFYYYCTFDDIAEFSRYIIEERLVADIFLIISHEEFYIQVIDLISTTQYYKEVFQKVYVYLPTKSHAPPITSCFSTSCRGTLFEKLSKDISQFTSSSNTLNWVADETDLEPAAQSTSSMNQISSSISVFHRTCQQITPIRHLTKESLNFLCFLTMTDILVQVPYDHEELSETWMTCRKIYKDNNAQLDRIDELENTYEACKAIHYYTGASCLSRAVNQVCHTENMQQIFQFRVYMADLHNLLVQHYAQGEENGINSCIENVYRGKPLSVSVLQQLIDNQGGLISMNGFLSTTVDCEVALEFAGDQQQMGKGYKSTLFLLTIDKKVRRPYAHIANCSAIQSEAEVLFSVGTIWRIKSVKHKKNPCEIELLSCDDMDSQLTELRNNYLKQGCNLSALGDILRELGDDDEAEWFYQKMLEQESLDDQTRGKLYCKIGMIRKEKEDSSVALENLEKAAFLLQPKISDLVETKTYPFLYKHDDQSTLIAIYNNMGLIHDKNNRFNQACRRYEQALEVKNGSKAEIATVHDNLGCLYFRNGKYDQAQKHHAEAIKLIDESHLCWTKFKENFNRANKRCDHLMKKEQNNKMQRTTTDELLE